MCLNFEITQNSCKQIILKDYSTYDLSKGNITSVKLYILVPGQTKPKINNIPFGQEIVLNSLNMGLSKSTSSLQDIAEGYYEFKIEVEQTLDILSKACCDDNDCSNKLSTNTKQIETLKLYREGLKSSAAQCKREYADELYKCLKTKISTLDDKCNCK
jgi:hypothetical protein